MVNPRASQARSERVNPVGWISPITWGLANAGIVLILGCSIIAFITSLFEVGERRVAIFLEIANLCAAMAGGFTAGKRSGRHGLPNGIIVALGYVILFTLLTGSGIPPIRLVSVGLRRTLVAIVAGAIGGIVGVNFAGPS